MNLIFKIYFKELIYTFNLFLLHNVITMIPMLKLPFI